MIRAALAAATLVLLAGCGGPIEVTAAPNAADPACALAWPEKVASQSQVAISPTSSAAAAWGDPAIIARCGFAALSPTTLDCIQVDGIDWVVEPLDDGVAFTTYGRDPALEVLVPKAYAPEPMVLPDFDQVAEALPRTGHACT